MQEQQALIKQLNAIEDVFFHKIAEDKDVCEEILRIILQKPKLKVIDAQTQRFLRNIGAHSVIVDLLCEDEDGARINVEMQKSKTIYHLETIIKETGTSIDDGIHQIFVNCAVNDGADIAELM